MEEALKPILLFIENPTRITFEDEIILIVKTMIKNSQTISPIQWEMFDQFEKIVQKGNGNMGDLLDCINYFMIYGK